MSEDRAPPDLDPEAAVERWLDRLQIDKADQTIADYGRRLRHFVRWCDDQGIERMQDLSRWDIEGYDSHRRANDPEPITLRNELLTFRQFLSYCARIGIVPEGLPDAVELPDVDHTQVSDDTLLRPADAERLLAAYRNGHDQYTRHHAFLELAFYTGARMGALRGLDLDDLAVGEQYVRFRHRPDQDTPLKNGQDGERIVGISEAVVDALATWIRKERPDTTDEYGRRPLFATKHGRASSNVIRTTAYYATVPCRYTECPHGNEQATCDWYSYSQSFRCPSSRSPHQIRSGSITWQLNRGVPIEVVAERVNASVGVIEEHYDQADELTAFEQRRQQHLDKLGIDSEEDEIA